MFGQSNFNPKQPANAPGGSGASPDKFAHAYDKFSAGTNAEKVQPVTLFKAIFGPGKKEKKEPVLQEKKEGSVFAKGSVEARKLTEWAKDNKRYQAGWHASTEKRIEWSKKQLEMMGVKESGRINPETFRKFYKGVEDGSIRPEGVARGSDAHRKYKEMMKGFYNSGDSNT